jgi:hypothetical protein
MTKKIRLAFAGFVFFAWAGFSSAQITITNGYVCGPKNIGGEDTRRFYREQDGVAENISPTSTFPVTCPVQVPFEDPPYFISLRVGHESNVTQRFACALEEYNVSSGLVRTIGRALSLQPGTASTIEWVNVFPQQSTNYFTVRCILPPLGGIGAITWF